MYIFVKPHQTNAKLHMQEEKVLNGWRVDAAQLDKLVKKLNKEYIGGRFEKGGALYAMSETDLIAKVRDMFGETVDEMELRLGKEGWKNLFKCLFLAAGCVGALYILALVVIKVWLILIFGVIFGAAFAGRHGGRF